MDLRLLRARGTTRLTELIDAIDIHRHADLDDLIDDEDVAELQDLSDIHGSGDLDDLVDEEDAEEEQLWSEAQPDPTTYASYAAYDADGTAAGISREDLDEAWRDAYELTKKEKTKFGRSGKTFLKQIDAWIDEQVQEHKAHERGLDGGGAAGA